MVLLCLVALACSHSYTYKSSCRAKMNSAKFSTPPYQECNNSASCVGFAFSLSDMGYHTLSASSTHNVQMCYPKKNK